MGCPASLAAERGLPNTRSIHAAEGTAAHSVAESILRALNPRWAGERPTFSKRAALDYVGETVEGWLISEDMAAPIQCYVDTVLAAAQGNILHVEQRVDFSHIVGVRNSFGTADAIIIDGKELQIHDLKFGRGVRVDAENNYQLMIYALGALRLYDLANEFTTVRLFIHQPRLDHVSEWALSVQELIAFGEKVKKAARKAIRLYEAAINGKIIPPQNYKPSPKACRWCKAAATCAAYTRFVYEQVAAEFVDVDAAEFDARDPMKLTEEQLTQAYNNLDFIEGWCGKIRAECYQRLNTGSALPGLKIVKGRPGNRRWKDADAAEDMLERLLPSAQLHSRSLITPAQAEKRLSPEDWDLLRHYITRSEGSPVIVPTSDPREPIAAGADEFDKL